MAALRENEGVQATVFLARKERGPHPGYYNQVDASMAEDAQSGILQFMYRPM